MNAVYVSIGSNIDPERMVPAAISALHRAFGRLDCSPVYRSAAVGFDGGEFLNLVCRFSTSQTPQQLNRTLHRIEDQHGRRRDDPGLTDRSLDLDLLLYGDLQLNEPGLILPRGEILRYAFVLRPLADLVPDQLHRVDGRSYAALWAAFDASSQPLTLSAPAQTLTT